MRRSTRAASQQFLSKPVTKVSKNLERSNSVTKRPKASPHRDRTKTTSNGQEKDGIIEKHEQLVQKKWGSWSKHANASPFPDFKRPTRRECEEAHRVLHKMHHEAVEKETNDPDLPETIPSVLDAMIVAILCQATSWSNAKRAMNSMKGVYSSVFAYDAITDGGIEKLQGTLRCGGLHIRKSKIIMSVLEEVELRYKKWDIDHIFDLSQEDAMKELMSYKYMGPKSAFVVLSWCLKKDVFTVDTHVYRIAGLWGWRPQKATREDTQAHLDAVVPTELKMKLHFLLIAHGRTCPRCRGGSKGDQQCEALEEIKDV
ncbi:DNA glycosylase [Pyrenochaeta sp. DS3sAY3a]|nr:DNA glycosylase [Pyrenochaeta sp. DS3sAY3a]